MWSVAFYVHYDVARWINLMKKKTTLEHILWSSTPTKHNEMVKDLLSDTFMASTFYEANNRQRHQLVTLYVRNVGRLTAGEPFVLVHYNTYKQFCRFKCESVILAVIFWYYKNLKTKWMIYESAIARRWMKYIIKQRHSNKTCENFQKLFQCVLLFLTYKFFDKVFLVNI